MDVWTEEEYDFIAKQNIYVGLPNTQNQFQLFSLNILYANKKIIWTNILNTQEIVALGIENSCILNDDIHFNHQKAILYFLELNEIEHEIKYILSDKLIYLQLEIKTQPYEIKFKEYNENIGLNIKTDFRFESENILFFANDYINNFISIRFNPSNKLGKLIIENPQELKVQELQRSMENIIQNAIIKNTLINNFSKDNNHYMVQFRMDSTVSKKLTGKFTDNFIQTFNTYLIGEFLPEFDIDKVEYESYKISSSNIPKWYLKTNE